MTFHRAARRDPGTTTRETWTDTVRGACIVLVVLFHYVVLQQNAHLVPAPLVWLNDAMAPFRMPLLMVLSGLFVPASLRHGPWRFVTRRLAGVAWPLVVWSLMSWGIQVIAAHGSAALSSPVESLLSTRLAAPAGVWFLAYLLVFSAIALLTRRLPPPIVAVVAWSIALVTPRVGTDPEIDRFFVLLAFFMGGVALTRLPSRLVAVARTPQAVVVSAVTAAACVAIAVAKGTDEVHYLPSMAPAVAVGMIAIVRAAQALQHRRVSRLLAVVGRRSVVYYLSHFVGLRWPWPSPSAWGRRASAGRCSASACRSASESPCTCSSPSCRRRTSSSAGRLVPGRERGGGGRASPDQISFE